MINSTAIEFMKSLGELGGNANNAKFFKDAEADSLNLNIRMSDIFATAKKHKNMSINEISKLLDSKYYEARMGAVSIMDFQARNKTTSSELRKELYNLYIKKHAQINNWDLVDRSAPYVVGGYLFDKSRAPLVKLAKSKNIWERRTSIVATYFFIRQGQIEDTFKIAEILVYDKEDLINKAVGSWIREAGKQNPERLKKFLDKHVLKMPRVTLRYAIEKLDRKARNYYLSAKKL
jgi:3-methyladenine DNA glycosylase AlkD